MTASTVMRLGLRDESCAPSMREAERSGVDLSQRKPGKRLDLESYVRFAARGAGGGELAWLSGLDDPPRDRAAAERYAVKKRGAQTKHARSPRPPR
jgi:hypothetical protein